MCARSDELNTNSAEFTALVAELLSGGKTVWFRANGLSMMPFVRHGDRLQVEPLAGRPLRRGDIVLFRAGDGFTAAHRITRLRHGATLRLLIQGDALLHPDGEVELDCVLGRVTALERQGRRWPLDSGWPRRLALIWLVLSPLSRWAYRAWLKLWR